MVGGYEKLMFIVRGVGRTNPPVNQTEEKPMPYIRFDRTGKTDPRGGFPQRDAATAVETLTDALFTAIVATRSGGVEYTIGEVVDRLNDLQNGNDKPIATFIGTTVHYLEGDES